MSLGEILRTALPLGPGLGAREGWTLALGLFELSEGVELGDALVLGLSEGVDDGSELMLGADVKDEGGAKPGG